MRSDLASPAEPAMSSTARHGTGATASPLIDTDTAGAMPGATHAADPDPEGGTSPAATATVSSTTPAAAVTRSTAAAGIEVSTMRMLLALPPSTDPLLNPVAGRRVLRTRSEPRHLLLRSPSLT